MSDKIGYYQTIPEMGIKGRMDTTKEFERIGMPKSLKDWDVLDIGCNTGAFLLEAWNRGADTLTGVEPDDDWRWLAKGILSESSVAMEHLLIYPDLENVEKDLSTLDFDLVLLLSITHLVEDPQSLFDRAWKLTKRLLIIEINDRLQVKKVVLPKEAVLYGKNKDNRSVYHIVKNNSGR